VKTYFVLWGYVANFSDEPIVIKARDPHDAKEKLYSRYSDEFRAKARVWVFDHAPALTTHGGDVVYNRAWIITKALFDADETGTKSRSWATCSTLVVDLVPFRMLDGDGNVYYEGLATPDADFQPLDDFGRPNAGCTEIQYKVDGIWQTL